MSDTVMDRLDSLFMLYLDEALVIFDSPHSYTNSERLDGYRRAFRKVVAPALRPVVDSGKYKEKVREILVQHEKVSHELHGGNLDQAREVTIAAISRAEG